MYKISFVVYGKNKPGAREQRLLSGLRILRKIRLQSRRLLNIPGRHEAKDGVGSDDDELLGSGHGDARPDATVERGEGCVVDKHGQYGPQNTHGNQGQRENDDD